MDNLDINSLLNASFDDSQEKVDLEQLFAKRLNEYGLTENQAAEMLDIERKSIAAILSGEAKQPNVLNVLKLSEFLDVKMEVILKTLISKQNAESIASLQAANRTTFIAKNFDVDRLHREGFLKSKSNSEYIVNRINSFFGFDSLYEFETYQKQHTIFFSQTRRSHTDKMRDFATQSAYRTFELINNPHDYKREDLLELVPKMKPYCRDVKDGLYIVCRALYNHGVTVILQKHLTTSQFRGATFIVKGKPCIVLTDLNNIYPTLWFALMHEIFHILFHFDEIKKHGYHITGQAQLSLTNEEEADSFAQDFFFDEEMYNYIKPLIHNAYMVESLAKENNIHPSFVYRGFQYFINKKDGADYWGAFRIHFADLLPLATAKLNPLSWKDENSLPNLAKKVKEIFELNG
jgi:HTH-type transcriptional regulator / antitoxin HigA